MLQMMILADDMTGALDSAVHFAKRGYNTLCSLHQLTALQDEGEAQVIIFNSESRNLPINQLENRLLPFLARMKEYGGRRFKKVDSTLRGSIGRELEIAIDALGVDAVIFCPAFVDSGRCVKKGELFLHGIRLDHTEVARDLPEDCCTAKVIDRLTHLTNLACFHVEEFAIEHLLAQLENGPHVFSFDASTREEIQQIIDCGEQLEQAGKRVLWCGSAGFSKALAQRLQPQAAVTENPSISKKSTLYLIGSRKMLSHNQARELVAKGTAICIRFPVNRLMQPHLLPVIRESEWKQIELAIQSGRDLVLTSMLDENYPDCEGNISKGLATMVSLILGKMHTSFSTILSVGGDTTGELIRELKGSKLRLLGEIEEAVPYSELETPMGKWQLVTKGGSVGELNTLLRVQAWIKGGLQNENEETRF